MEPRVALCSVAHAAFVLRAHRRMLALPEYFRLSEPPQGTLFGLIGRAATNVVSTLLVLMQKMHTQRPHPTLRRIAFASHAVRADVALRYDTPPDAAAWEGLTDDLRALVVELLPTEEAVYTTQCSRPGDWLFGPASNTRRELLEEVTSATVWVRDGPPATRPVSEPLPLDLHRSVCALHDASKICWRLAEFLLEANRTDPAGCNAYASAANYGTLFEWFLDILLSGARDLAPFRAQLRVPPTPRPSTPAVSVGVQAPPPIKVPRKRKRGDTTDAADAWICEQSLGVACLLRLLRATDASFAVARPIPRFFFTTVLLLVWKERGKLGVECELEYVYGADPEPFYTQSRLPGDLPWPALLSTMDGELRSSIPQEICDEALRVYAMIPMHEEGFIEDWPEEVRPFLQRVVRARRLDSALGDAMGLGA